MILGDKPLISEVVLSQHIQWRSAETPIRNRVIRRTDNKKRDRKRPNLTKKKFVKRDLKDWYIIKKLSLNMREWKLAIHVSEP
jgi:hypothetical protein